MNYDAKVIGAVDLQRSAYSSLPYGLKTAVATARGYQLRWWRYSRQTERLVHEALERESWTSSQWKAWREGKLARMLNHAATQVPYYRACWQRRRQAGDHASWEQLENWPILEKETVRANPRAFVADSSRNKSLFVDHTGGTTGTPTLIYESRETVVRWYALLEARLRRWHGVDYRQRWGMFGGQQVIPLNQKSPPYWVRNYGLAQLYLSVFHVSAESAKHYISALVRFRPLYMVVYPSIVATLAQHMLEQGLKPPSIKTIFCNSEKVDAGHRASMQAAFKCPVVDTYGMAELTAAGSECQAGIMHEWPEVGVLEILDRSTGDFLRDANQAGDFVMTGLLNEDMPLIRYANGDRGTLSDPEYRCACGRALPRFGDLQGRANDFIVARDGRRLYILDSLFNGLPLIEAQFIQETLDLIRIRLVPTPRFDEKAAQALAERVCQYLGDVRIELDLTPRIPRDGNGKFLPFVSRLSP